jgi:hypothetical protein
VSIDAKHDILNDPRPRRCLRRQKLTNHSTAAKYTDNALKINTNIKLLRLNFGLHHRFTSVLLDMNSIPTSQLANILGATETS